MAARTKLKVARSIVEARKAGASNAQIAKEHNITLRTVSRVLRRMKIPAIRGRNTQALSQAVQDAIFRQYIEKQKTDYIAELHGVNLTTIRRVVLRNGGTLRKSGRPKCENHHSSPQPSAPSSVQSLPPASQPQSR